MTTRFSDIAVSRRAALQGMAGLVVAIQLPVGRAVAQQSSGPFAPNAYIRIAPDSTVTVISRSLEFGQGPYTGFATLVAEELDADWSQVRAEAAPANIVYANPVMVAGSMILTTRLNVSRQPLRSPALCR